MAWGFGTGGLGSSGFGAGFWLCFPSPKLVDFNNCGVRFLLSIPNW